MASSVSSLKEPRDESKVDEERTIPCLYPSKDFKLFQLFFIAADEGQSVEVVETQEIDFEEVSQRLKHGESVFIPCKSVHELNLDPNKIEDVVEPWSAA